jgi:KUP system potassium uptake protein
VLVVAAAFRTSTALASAYGMAVTVAMAIDGLLAGFIAARWCWRRHQYWLIAPGLVLMGGLLIVDLLLIAACALKFLSGAWLPLAIAVVVFTLMTTWAKGCELLLASIQGEIPPMRPFIAWLAGEDTQRTCRTAVYMVSHAGTVPRSLLSNLKHNKVQVSSLH